MIDLIRNCDYWIYWVCEVKIRVVKMGWNPRANPTHHGFGSGWVGIFL